MSSEPIFRRDEGLSRFFGGNGEGLGGRGVAFQGARLATHGNAYEGLHVGPDSPVRWTPFLRARRTSFSILCVTVLKTKV